MQYAIDETERRRKKQISYNIKNKITPKTVISKISNILENLSEGNEENKNSKQVGKSIKQSIQELQSEMEQAAINLEFEEAAKIRDKIKILQQKELGLMVAPKENYRSKFSKKK